jgi:transcription initiation factor IIF auxiliary subunit
VALKIAQDYEYVGEDYWKWWAWIEGPAKELNQIESVNYNLHPTFKNLVRTITSRQNKFRLETAGWGVFMLYATVLGKDGSKSKLKHYIELRYPGGKATHA